MILIQNADVAASKRDYVHLKSDELLVHNTFTTLQGEGPWAGTKSFFVRLAGCNYGDKGSYCGFCDTAFHLKNGRVTKVHDLSVQAANSASLVVITGGEPLLQTKALVEFVQQNSNLIYQIETNGAFHKEIQSLLDLGVHIVCSPKAGPTGYNENLIRSLLRYLPQENFYLKFVVSADEDESHYALPPQIFEESRRTKIFISPMAVYKRPYQGEVSSAWDHTLIDPVATSRNYRYAAQLCINNNFRLSIQQHLFCELA